MGRKRKEEEGNYASSTDGLEQIEMLREINRHEYQSTKPQSRIVGAFGIVSESGEELIVAWKQTKRTRKTQVDPKLQVAAPLGNYARDMFNSMFKHWDDVPKLEVTGR